MAATGAGCEPARPVRQLARLPRELQAVLACRTGDVAHPGAFEFRFAASAPGSDEARCARVPLAVLGPGGSCEHWYGAALGAGDTQGGGGRGESAAHLFLHQHALCGSDADMARVVEEHYGLLLDRARRLGFPCVVRVWNFVPAINLGDGDAETYVRFNSGRAAAFRRAAFADPADPAYPAATAVGSAPGSPLVIVMLVSERPALPIENPRQVSAYRYPRRYGPVPPAFARAALLRHAGEGSLFIAGTSSIVGHESRHDTLAAQIEETLVNIDGILAAALQRAPDLVVGPQRSWRVYLRDPDHVAVARRAIGSRLGDPRQLLFLQADICRRELLVEIDGWCGMTALPTAGC